MVDKVRFTFDIALQETMTSETIVYLTESLHSFIDHGIIDCEEDEEIVIDQDYLSDLIHGIELLRKAHKKYGRDDCGLVKYPFVEA